jgi:sec-independent protein translocase protein TatB
VLGFSFSEIVLIGVVALVAVGPQRLPGMLRDFGKWMRKLRKVTTEVRQQTGIDEMLRAEGLHGGLNELRSLMRGGGGPLAGTAPPAAYRPPEDPYAQLEIDVSHEYPPEGPDAKGALPDDLVASNEADAATSAEKDAVTTAAPNPADPATSAAHDAATAATTEPAPPAKDEASAAAKEPAVAVNEDTSRPA